MSDFMIKHFAAQEAAAKNQPQYVRDDNCHNFPLELRAPHAERIDRCPGSYDASVHAPSYVVLHIAIDAADWQDIEAAINAAPGRAITVPLRIVDGSSEIRCAKGRWVEAFLAGKRL